ncbi:MAG: GlsB/YeaQ/YmgE family stress response membrane protein [Chloroflexota bacterium]
MDGASLIAWIIVGAIAGWLASIVMKTNARQGLITDIIVGIIGGLIGGWLLSALGVGGGVSGINIGSILTAFIGAVVLLGILRVVRRNS